MSGSRRHAYTSGIQRVADLPRGWDGQGSPPLQDRARLVAGTLLDVIDLDDMPTPQIVPVVGGGIQIEWVAGPRELEIEIRPTGRIVYLGTCEERDVLEGETDDVNDIARVVRWLACAVSDMAGGK